MSDKLYYTIGEVSEMFNINPSVVRFWEKEFPQINPQKGARGVRRYSADSVEVIRRIYHLTRECGFTLNGAKEQLRTDGRLDEKMQLVQTLTQAKQFLLELKDQL
ncbi:MAG: MerR family transcriptional regulator [Bacteroidales bacterium]|nr:MerR family transcriptional regulator [Bacteroidales bacterium]